SMTFWRNALASGASIDDVAQAILNNDEALGAAYYPQAGLSTAQYQLQLVTRTYQTMLGRAASAPEIAEWTSALAGTAGQSAIGAGTFVLRLADRVASYAGNDPAAVAETSRFIDRVAVAAKFWQLGYNASGTISGAIVTAVGAAATPQLAAGAAAASVTASWSLAQLMLQTAQNAGAATPYEVARMTLSRLYAALLNRAPDAHGLAFYMNSASASSGGMTAAAAAMLTSNEALSSGNLAAMKLVNGTLVPLSNREFVERVYQLALGSVPVSAAAAAEISVFVGQLDGGISRAQSAVNIVTGMLGFGQLSAAETALRATFDNKAAVGLAYAVDLGMDDAAIARGILARVTPTDVATALAYAYAQAQVLLATGAAAIALAAQQGADAAHAGATGVGAAPPGSSGDVNAITSQAPTAALRLQLMQMYVGILGRTSASFQATPDLAGMNFFIDHMSGQTLADFAQSFITSPEGLAIYPASLSNTEFVTKVFATVLGASSAVVPDIARWVANLLPPQSMTRGAVALGILNVVQDYSHVANDAATLANLQARVDLAQRVATAFTVVDIAATAAATQANSAAAAEQLLLNAQNAVVAPLKTLQDAAAAAFSSAQATMLAELAKVLDQGDHTGVTRLQINRLYATLLQRTVAPTLSEIDFWINGGQPLDVIAQQIMSSAEAGTSFTANGVPLQGKALVDKLFERILGRPSDDAGSSYWQGVQTQQGLSRGQLAMAMLTTYEDNFSDNTPAYLATKVTLDTRVNAFLSSQQSEAIINEVGLQNSYNYYVSAAASAQTTALASLSAVAPALNAYGAAIGAANDARYALGQSAFADLSFARAVFGGATFSTVLADLHSGQTFDGI
ncbi:MAG TPA: DUF4214 domain-containing protein, partial [Telluria sp.]|nr:DUF4214 domain-containing protein [Telluria sp.]